MADNVTLSTQEKCEREYMEPIKEYLAVTNKNLQENNCCGGIFLKYMKIFIYI